MKPNILIKLLLHFVGLLIMTFGIALTAKAGIGVAAVSTIAFAGSKLLPLTFGMCSSSFHAFCFISQLVITRRVTATSFLQIPMVYLFGFFLDFYGGLLHITPSGFLAGCLLVLVGTLIFSLGLRITLGVNIALTPADGLARAVGAKVGWPIAKAKFVFDISVVAVSAVLTTIFMQDPFVSVGAGTVITMLLAGPCIGMFYRLLPLPGIDEQKK